MTEVGPGTGVVRLDDPGVAQLLDAASGDVDDPAVTTRLADAGLLPALEALRAPLVTLELLIAGTSLRLRHRVWVDLERAVVLLAVRPGVHQVLVVPPSHVAAALVRMARLRPRRTGERAPRAWPADRLDELVDDDLAVRVPALADAGAGFAWRLGVTGAGDRLDLTAIDGEEGLHLADAGDEVLRPITNTAAYRIFATLLPAAAG